MWPPVIVWLEHYSEPMHPWDQDDPAVVIVEPHRWVMTTTTTRGNARAKARVEAAANARGKAGAEARARV